MEDPPPPSSSSPILLMVVVVEIGPSGSRLEVREAFGRFWAWLRLPGRPRRHGRIRIEILALTHPWAGPRVCF